VSVLLRASEGTLLSGRDRRAENCRALLRTFHAESNAKHFIDLALPDLLAGRATLDIFSGMLKDGHMAALAAVLNS
jgi:hypothetical protein